MTPPSTQPTCLIADDDGVTRAELVALLEREWPLLRVIGQASNGADAWDLFLEREPDICFLDMRMPGLTGIEVAQRIGSSAQVVLMAAQSDPALRSTASLHIGHLLKPFELHQASTQFDRLRNFNGTTAAPDRTRTTERQSRPVRRSSAVETIPGSLGRETQEVTVDEIVYLEAEGRFTRVVQTSGSTQARYALKELVPQLDPEEFWQIHRFIIVNRHHVDTIVELESGAVLTLKGRGERLPVGAHFLDRLRRAAA